MLSVTHQASALIRPKDHHRRYRKAVASIMAALMEETTVCRSALVLHDLFNSPPAIPGSRRQHRLRRWRIRIWYNSKRDVSLHSLNISLQERLHRVTTALSTVVLKVNNSLFKKTL